MATSNFSHTKGPIQLSWLNELSYSFRSAKTILKSDRTLISMRYLQIYKICFYLDLLEQDVDYGGQITVSYICPVLFIESFYSGLLSKS